MTDIKHLQQDVAYVRTHVEKLERMLAHQIRNDPEAKKAATALFAETPDLAKLYLAFDQPRNQQSVGKTLGMDKTKVSRLVRILLRHDFLQKLPDGTYAWTDFHRLLDLERIAKAAVKAQGAAAKPDDSTAIDEGTTANGSTDAAASAVGEPLDG